MLQIVENIHADNELKQIIAKIKHDMFWQNTHGWSGLKDSTIKRKKSMHDLLAASPESINIRTGDLVDAFSNSVNIDLKSDFKVAYKLSSFQEKKVQTVAEYGRPVTEITDAEYQEVVNFVINNIARKLKEQYAS